MKKVILYLLGASLLLFSCEKSNNEEIETNTYRMEINIAGELSGFQTNFSVSNDLGYGGAILYNHLKEVISSPHSFTKAEIDTKNNTFYSTFTGKGQSIFTFGGTAYKFTENKDLIDSVNVNIKGYINDILIIDTCHVFRSYGAEEAIKYQDSIQKQNNFQLVISKYNKLTI